jgi:hypothetical protein
MAKLTEHTLSGGPVVGTTPTVVPVCEVRALAAQGMCQNDLAGTFGMKRHSVSGIVRVNSWHHVHPGS